LNFAPKDFTQVDSIGTIEYGTFAYVQLGWPASKNTTMVGPGGSSGSVQANPHVLWLIELSQGETAGVTSLQTVASQRQETDLQSGNYTIISPTYSGTMPYHIVGVSLAHLQLSYLAWVEESTYNSPTADEELQALTVLVEWGYDYNGSLEYLSFYFPFNVGAYTTDAEHLPLSVVCNNLLGGSSTVKDYVASIIHGLVNDLANNTMFLQGAPPEDLVLYQRPPTNSINPANLLAPLFSSPPTSVQQYYAAFNQYDAGVFYQLPCQFTVPDGLQVCSGYVPGGNSCGPVCLRLALSKAGVALAPTAIYANVMVSGWTGSMPGTANEYDWDESQLWINGEVMNHTLKKPFTPQLTLPVATRCNFLTGRTSQQIAADWAYVDTILSKQLHPLLLRTDLSLNRVGSGYRTTSDGHIILLVGEGHSDYVAQAYGSSGDYYVVVDPAGHYYANQTGYHYGTVQYLMDQNVGINHGGWYAIYPKDALQRRISDQQNGGNVFRMEGINLPGEMLRVEVRSPAALRVTDGAGNWTGIETNGTIVENIPNSAYDAEWADADEDGTGEYVPDGIKAVIINGPMSGRYQAQITGSRNGPFNLVWSDVGGGHDFSGSVTNTIQIGQQLTYSIGLVPPNLGINIAGSLVVLSWSTNVPGFVLQRSSPTLTSGWLAVD
jgi:hypothetical protein